MNTELKNILISDSNKISRVNTTHDVKNKNISADIKDRNEFLDILNKQTPANNDDGIRLSSHAIKRLEERNIEMDGEEFVKLQEAFQRLKNKGGRDSLVITDKAAYIIDVAKKTVVTAIDKNNMGENVFTKIDSTIII